MIAVLDFGRPLGFALLVGQYRVGMPLSLGVYHPVCLRASRV